MIILYLFLIFSHCLAASCDGADQINSGVSIAYTLTTPKLESRKRQAIEILGWYKNWLNDFNSRQSFKAVNGDIVGFMWVGSMIQNSGFSRNVLPDFINEISNSGMPDEIYYEFIHNNAMQSFGIILTSRGIEKAQKAVKMWSSGQGYGEKTGSKSSSSLSICYLGYSNRKKEVNDVEAGECMYNSLSNGQNPSGNIGEYLVAFNQNLNFNSLGVGQKYCYTEGVLPDFRPKMKDDGTCFSYNVKKGDTCNDIIGKYSPLSLNDINKFNSKTYKWKGCNSLMVGQNICLSEGKSPRPDPDPNAECGPLAPGNWIDPPECPNKACCSEFGYCGLTADFCDNKNNPNGAPGTNGCYSNCGYGSFPKVKANNFKRVAYAMNQNNVYGYDIVHHSFARINKDMTISLDRDFPNTDTNTKRIITIGGWEQSTSPSTYQIYRDMVSDEKRDLFAQNVINFIKNYDGVNFDWEYPEAPDIPGIPPGNKGDGIRYAKLLRKIKESDRSKLVSVAIPASYWYLKGYPLIEMDKVVDYFVLMNYDYTGQWDYGKTGIGCHLDRSITEKALKLIVKSGIDTTKVYGGLGNYGRAYELVDKNCRTYGCPFKGPASTVPAGDITKVSGFLSIYEINNMNFWETKFNADSKCFYGMWGDKYWVSWMKESDIQYTEDWFKNDVGIGGSALWLYDYYKDGEDEEIYWLEEDVEDEVFCYYNEDVKENDENYQCLSENIISFYIKNLEDAKNSIINFKNDKNYIKYYEAYIRSYFDQVMTKYEDWVLKNNYRNLQKYFTYKKDSKITKREYTNDTISSNLTILLRPEKSVVISEDDTVFVKTSKLNEYINKTTEYSKRDGPGRISEEGNGLVLTYIIDNSIIEDKNAVEAMKSFNSDYGLNVQPNALTTIKLKEFEYGSSKAGYEPYKFRSSTILNSKVLIPDPLANVTDDIINSINNIITKTKTQIGYENNLDIYDVIENFLIFIDINEAAKNIYIEGKKQDEAYNKAYKMKILSIILGIFGGLTLMLSPVEEIVANIILVAVDLIATDGIQGGLNSSDIGWGIAGIFGSLLGLVKTDVKFIEMVKYVNKGKGYKELEVFPHIKKARETFYGKVC